MQKKSELTNGYIAMFNAYIFVELEYSTKKNQIIMHNLVDIILIN